MNDRFSAISPLDYRYPSAEISPYLDEHAFTTSKLRVELALVRALAKRGICSEETVKQVAHACELVKTKDVYDEEARTRHDIRALVNCICRHIDEEHRWVVHLTATSFDIIDTANALRYKEMLRGLLIPTLKELLNVLVNLAVREAATVQVGRTHGQHAVPITFGFAMANFVSRLGDGIANLSTEGDLLVGKFSGAVGAYNASSLLFGDGHDFESDVMSELGLKAAEHSTQIVPPEPLMRVIHELVMISGIMADLAHDMRHLQRSEIGEVGEAFEADQVGSSTMPQKRNPVSLENVASMHKVVIGHFTTVMLDQTSEHQRDLTNSASGRFKAEIFAIVQYMARRLTGTMKKLSVDTENLKRNLSMNAGQIMAEPLYILLASRGVADAHEIVRKLTLRAQAEARPLMELVNEDETLRQQLEVVTDEQRRIVSDPSLYTGMAEQRAKDIARLWQNTWS